MIIKIDIDDSTGYDELYTEWFNCPKCTCDKILSSYKYCPNCGIKIKFKNGHRRKVLLQKYKDILS
jgi:hypothetical protein